MCLGTKLPKLFVSTHTTTFTVWEFSIRKKKIIRYIITMARNSIVAVVVGRSFDVVAGWPSSFNRAKIVSELHWLSFLWRRRAFQKSCEIPFGRIRVVVEAKVSIEMGDEENVFLHARGSEKTQICQQNQPYWRLLAESLGWKSSRLTPKRLATWCGAVLWHKQVQQMFDGRASFAEAW